MNTTPVSLDNEIEKVCNILNRGQTICYPTDTIWGIGCDATNSTAVEKIYKIKERDPLKSMLILVDSYDMAERYVAKIPNEAKKIFENTKHPLTIIFDNAQNLASNLPAKDGSIGVRIVKHKFCSPLIKIFGKPIVSTSANISGKPAPETFADISNDIIDAVDYVVCNERSSKTSKTSEIIRLRANGSIEIIRK